MVTGQVMDTKKKKNQREESQTHLSGVSIQSNTIIQLKQVNFTELRSKERS